MLPNRWDAKEAAFYRSLGRSIKRARIAAGLRQVDLANLVGSSKPALANIEGGRAAPSVYRLTIIMAALGPHAREVAMPDPVGARFSAIECCEQEALEPEGAGHSPDCMRRAG